MQACGPDRDYQLEGPLVLSRARVNGKECDAFVWAIRSQGSAEIRQQAISLSLERARQDPRLTNRAYRVLCQIASRVRWHYRYHCETLGLLAHFSAGDPSNLHRELNELVKLGYVAQVRVPRRGGGKPTRYLTLNCIEQDRSGETRALLDQAARRATGDQPNRQDDGSQTVMVTDSGVPSPSPGRTTNRRSDEHIVDSNCRREKADHCDIEICGGKIVLHNGERSQWLSTFGDDPKRLELELIRAVKYVRPNKPLAVEVRGQLARQAAEAADADRRYTQRQVAKRVGREKTQPSTGTVVDTQDTSNDPTCFRAGSPEFDGEIARLRREGEFEEASKFMTRGWVKLKPVDAKRALSLVADAQSVALPDVRLQA